MKSRVAITTIISMIVFSTCISKPKITEKLPSIDILLPDSETVINISSFLRKENKVLIFFSPDCEHCQKMTESILTNLTYLPNTKFIFITIDDLDRIKEFYLYFGLSKHREITIGKDINFEFIKKYKPKQPPYTIVFNEDNEQKAVFEGEWKIQNLKDAIYEF